MRLSAVDEVAPPQAVPTSQGTPPAIIGVTTGRVRS